MIKKISFLTLICCTTFVVEAQGYYNIEELQNDSELYERFDRLWESTNQQQIDWLNHFIDSLKNDSGVLSEDYIEVAERKIRNQNRDVRGTEINDFGIGKGYEASQDSAIGVFLKAKNMSFCIGEDNQNIPSIFFAKPNTDLTQKLIQSINQNTINSTSNVSDLKIAFFDFSAFKGNYEEIFSKHYYKRLSAEEKYDMSTEIDKEVAQLISTLKKASKLVAEENGIDMVINATYKNSRDWENVVIKGKDKFDITDLIIKKWQGEKSESKYLGTVKPKVAGIHSKAILQLVLDVHPLWLSRSKEILAKYSSLHQKAIQNQEYEQAEQYQSQASRSLGRLRDSITPIIEEQVKQIALEYANNNGFDILLSIDLDEETNFFKNRKYIHIVSENIISQKVVTIFEEKYLKQ